MKKITTLFVMLLWIIPIITLASPILNDGTYMPIQYNDNDNLYESYVNNGDLVTGIPSNNKGIYFNLLNDYMETTYGIVLVPILNDVCANDCTGTWKMTDIIDFYTIKAGNNFALYLVNPEDTYRFWSTYNLWLANDCNENFFDVSNFRCYKSHPAPVPEPTTILLLGSGLFCLLGSRRKKLL